MAEASDEGTIGKPELQEIKNRVELLPENLGETFEQECFGPVKQLHRENVININDKVLELASLHSRIKEKRAINDNLSVLAHYLPLLKANFLMNDPRKFARIAGRFVDRNNQVSLHNTLALISSFGDELIQVNSVYRQFFTWISEHGNLEQITSINDILVKKNMMDLRIIHERHKSLVRDIGAAFVEITRNRLKIDG